MESCDAVRETLSAHADGESGVLDRAAIDGHLPVCPGCAAYATALVDLAGRLRLAPVADVPDLTAAILADAPPAPVMAAAPPTADPSRWRTLRGVLALAGIVQLLLALPVLAGVGGDHVAREIGIFEAALGAGFLVAARRPRLAAGLVPLTAVVAALLVVTSVVDIVAGHATPIGETSHLLPVIGTALLVVLERQGGGTLHPLLT
jgi:predicted anti-sigma-YlaC factor YlaD